MITTLLFDFSRVLLFPKDKSYRGELNPLHAELSKNPNYKFLDYFELNAELLRFLKGIKDRSELYIFTSGTIQDAPEIQPTLRDIFVRVYSAERIGFSKKDPDSYSFIANDLGINAGEILFIDDTAANIEAARAAGLETLLFVSTQETVDGIKEIMH